MKKFFCLISLLIVGYCCFASTYLRYNEEQKKYYIYDDATGATTVINTDMRGEELKEEIKEAKSDIKRIKEDMEKYSPEYKEEFEEILEDYETYYKYLMECKKSEDKENKNWK